MTTLLQAMLGQLIRKGALEVSRADGSSFTVGDGGPPLSAIALTDRAAERELALDPELALGELYMAGRLRIFRGDVYDLLALPCSNLGALGQLGGGWRRSLRWAAERLRAVNGRRARANAAHHYDLDGRLYDLFLDADRQYSCAYFEREDMGLDEAQAAKKRHIAAKLALSPGQRVLDIGSGWGGLALYLARLCGAEVLGVTLSGEQLTLARERAETAGLSDRARFDLRDYREVEGRYDRIVSVGMFEHVGPRNYNAFFARVAGLLAQDGVALIHTIAHFGPPAPTNPWVRKHVFPDGHIPALAEIAPAIARSGLIVSDMETLRHHYAWTLRHWRTRFAARRDEARALLGERFCRMWEFYLAGAECSFRYLGCCVAQFQLVKSLDALPATRGYIERGERRLRGFEQARLPAAAE